MVEQDCVYLDLDGRDLEPATRHVWVEEDGRVVACARVLAQPEGSSIGRVVTAASHRGRGLGGDVVRAALALASAAPPVTIHAQAHLADWYAGFGFVLDGQEFLEDGIPHVPMVRR